MLRQICYDNFDSRHNIARHGEFGSQHGAICLGCLGCVGRLQFVQGGRLLLRNPLWITLSLFGICNWLRRNYPWNFCPNCRLFFSAIKSDIYWIRYMATQCLNTQFKHVATLWKDNGTVLKHHFGL